MAASTTRAKKQQQQGDAMHGTLASEAHGVARLRTCSPSCSDPTTPPTVQHEFLGVAPAEWEWWLVAADVSVMGPAELALHAARLQALRATLIRQMQGTTTEKKQGVDDGGVVSSRSSERLRDGRRCPPPPLGKIRRS
jgi:hypothetical protein